MRLLILLTAATIVIMHVAMVSAQNEALVTPQPEHKLLERLAGDWQFEKRSVPQEGADPEDLGSGEISAEMVGDFFVVSRWSGTQYGFDYKAFQSLGYDIEQKQYTGCWVDSFMSHRWELSGAVEEQSQEFTLTASGPGPTGGTMTFRERYQFHSPDSVTIIGEMQRGEHWVSFSTTRLTRKK